MLVCCFWGPLSLLKHLTSKRSSINDHRGGSQGFSDNSTKALGIKSVTKGRGAKNIQNCMTSFMDDP
jgi:hypothetical protein